MSSNYVTLYDYTKGTSVTMSNDTFIELHNATVKCAEMVLALAEQEVNLAKLYQTNWTTIEIDMAILADELFNSLGIDHVHHIAVNLSSDKSYGIVLQRDRVTDASDPRGYYIKSYFTVSREKVSIL